MIKAIHNLLLSFLRLCRHGPRTTINIYIYIYADRTSRRRKIPLWITRLLFLLKYYEKSSSSYLIKKIEGYTYIFFPISRIFKISAYLRRGTRQRVDWKKKKRFRAAERKVRAVPRGENARQDSKFGEKKKIYKYRKKRNPPAVPLAALCVYLRALSFYSPRAVNAVVARLELSAAELTAGGAHCCWRVAAVPVTAAADRGDVVTAAPGRGWHRPTKRSVFSTFVFYNVFFFARTSSCRGKRVRRGLVSLDTKKKKKNPRTACARETVFGGLFFSFFSLAYWRKPTRRIARLARRRQNTVTDDVNSRADRCATLLSPALAAAYAVSPPPPVLLDGRGGAPSDGGGTTRRGRRRVGRAERRAGRRVHGAAAAAAGAPGTAGAMPVDQSERSGHAPPSLITPSAAKRRP